MGWLLYLAEKFDSDAFCKEIWYLIGVSVALVTGKSMEVYLSMHQVPLPSQRLFTWR